MEGRVLNTTDYEPLTKRKRIFHSVSPDELVVESQYDVTDLIEANKGRMALVDERARWGDGRIVASIPTHIFLRLQEEGVTDDEMAFLRWIQDPANSAFRVTPGKLI